MKILVIPDVHSRKFWKKATSNIDNIDKVIFLGDYVDPYPNEYQENPELMYDNPTECLQEIVNFKKELGDKCVLLLGNHIDHYLWQEFPESTRFNRFKEKEYINILKENLDLFNLIWVENDVIFSHAGLTDLWVKNALNDLKLSSTEDLLKVLKETPITLENYPFINLLGMVSYRRGGENSTGSCEWADITEHFDKEMNPADYSPYFQVFGHTQIKKPIITDTWACLDCRKGFEINTKTHYIEEYNNSL